VDNRRLLIAVLVSMAIWLGWTLLFPEKPKFGDVTFSPPTAEQPQADENTRLRRGIRTLELEQQRALYALHQASILLATAGASMEREFPRVLSLRWPRDV